MYIQPQTNIKLLHNVPLDPTYDHTIYFANAAAQTTYFSGLVKYNLINQSYQRVNKGVARVGYKADLLYDCNYMMFQNTAFGSKWFYAFITSVEYVNNECSDVYFEMDVLQTWYFDYEIDRCFVQREHSLTDVIGDHIEPETVATGEYVFNNYQALFDLRDLAICIAIVDTNNTTNGTMYDGIYGSAEIWAYPANTDGVQLVNAKVNQYVQKPDAIIGMYMCPLDIIGTLTPDPRWQDNPEDNPGYHLGYGASGVSLQAQLPAPVLTDTLDGYRPKNNKMYTYPYNFVHVDNANGSELSLRYEFFEGKRPAFQVFGTITQPVECMLRPCSYKGVPGYQQGFGYTSLNTETLQLSGFPICSWNVDAYQAWVAQNSVPLVLNTAADIGKMAIGSTFSTNPGASLATGIIGEVSNIMSQVYQASISADISKGSFNNGGANIAATKQSFFWGRCSVTAEYARMIDEYFTMFGYATNRVKKPNIGTRPHWNYVKTLGCTITGSIPGDDARKICNIYNTGITFWKNGSEVGDYSLDNSVI